METLIQALRRNPHNLKAAAQLTRRLSLEGKYDQAVSILEPAWRRAKHPGLALMLAGAYEALGRGEEAIPLLQEAIRQDPQKTPEAFLLLGGMLERAGREEQAVGVLQRALSLRPDSLEARLMLAAIHGKLGKQQEATRFVNQALELSPQDPDALALKGLSCAQRGNKEEATKYLERALSHDPTHRGTRELLDGMKKNEPKGCLASLGLFTIFTIVALLALSLFLL